MSNDCKGNAGMPPTDPLADERAENDILRLECQKYRACIAELEAENKRLRGLVEGLTLALKILRKPAKEDDRDYAITIEERDLALDENMKLREQLEKEE